MVNHIILFYSDVNKRTQRQITLAEFIVKNKKILLGQNIKIIAQTITKNMLRDSRITSVMEKKDIKALPVLLTPKRNYYERPGEKVTITDYYKSIINLIESDNEQQKQQQYRPPPVADDRDGDELERYQRDTMFGTKKQKKRQQPQPPPEEYDSGESDDDVGDSGEIDKILKNAASISKRRQISIPGRKSRQINKKDEYEEEDDDQKINFKSKHGEQSEVNNPDSMSREDNVGPLSKYLEGLDDDASEQYAKSAIANNKHVKVEKSDDDMMYEKLGLDSL